MGRNSSTTVPELNEGGRASRCSGGQEARAAKARAGGLGEVYQATIAEEAWRQLTQFELTRGARGLPGEQSIMANAPCVIVCTDAVGVSSHQPGRLNIVVLAVVCDLVFSTLIDASHEI
jgi:hypothetical protein